MPRDPAISDEDAALAASYLADKRWMDLVKLVSKQAAQVAPANRAAYHLCVAEIYQDRFANQAEAIKAYERVLEHDRGHRKAIEQLCSLYEKRRDWEKYFELEKGEVDRLPPEQQRDRVVELARLAAARLGKPDITIYWWQRVLALEPDHRQALAELSKSFERAERWSDLISVLEQQIELAPGNDEQVAALAQLATIRTDQLHDLEGARDAWQRLLDIDPKHAPAKTALAALVADESAAAPVTRAPVAEAVPTRSAAVTVAIGLAVVVAIALAIYVAL